VEIEDHAGQLADEGSALSSVHAARLRREAKRRRSKQSRHSPVAEARWQEMWLRLSAFATAHGHCNVPTLYDGGKALGAWCQRQRHHRRRGLLAASRVERLEGIGFSWDPMVEDWDEKLRLLERFKKEHGHCRVVPSLVRTSDERALRKWIHRQRGLRREGKLAPERLTQLENLGLEWEVADRPWEEKYAEVLAYQERHGAGSFPTRGSPEKALLAWVEKQRTKYHRRRLDPKKARRLEEVGMDWSPMESRRREMMDALRRFKKRHGHCAVLRSYREHPGLAQYVQHLRSAWRAGRLSSERIAELERLGFRWDGARAYLEALWDGMRKKLAAFKRAHGHCNVPEVWARDPALGKWVQGQRARKKKGRLSDTQVRALEELGFLWSMAGRKWEGHFGELERFVHTHGHCRVTKRSEAPPGLFRWVCWQRQLRKKGILASARIARLDKLGFPWAVDAVRPRP
jgi:hypothetical protein